MPEHSGSYLFSVVVKIGHESYNLQDMKMPCEDDIWCTEATLFKLSDIISDELDEYLEARGIKGNWQVSAFARNGGPCIDYWVVTDSDDSPLDEFEFCHEIQQKNGWIICAKSVSDA